MRALAIACLASGVGAQPPGTVRIDVIRARRDATIDGWLAARTADSLAGVRARALRADTVRAPGFVVIAPVAVADSARRAMITLDTLASHFPALPLPEGTVTYRLRPDMAHVNMDSVRFWYVDRVSPTGREEMRDWWDGPPIPAELGRRIFIDRLARAQGALPAAFNAWLVATLADTTLGDMWSDAYVSLVTSPTLVARRCVIGDAAGCRAALLLDRVADPLVEWLSPETRRQLAGLMAERVRTWSKLEHLKMRADSVESGLRQCLGNSDDAACTALVRRYLPDVASDPIGGMGRHTLVVAAMSMPRAPGLTAVLGRPALSATATLEAIAGVPIDRIVEQWRARTLAAKPDRVVLGAPRVLSAVAWLLIFSACATRASRWR